MEGYVKELAELLTAKLRVTSLRSEEMEVRAGLNSLMQILRQTRLLEKKVLLVGNGGSASIVAHMANDMMKMDQMRAMTFTEPSLLTALTNDDGYDTAYAQQVARWGEHRDLLIAVSSSGKSENILAACDAARKKRMHVVTFSGFGTDNPLRRRGDLNLYIPSDEYGMVELGHSIIGHYLTDQLAVKATAVEVGV